MASVIDNLRRHGVVGVLILLNVAMFFVAGLSMVFGKLGSVPSLEPWLALPASPALMLTRPWTLFTYMFTHTHPLHLLMNLLWLGWFGSLLLTVVSARRLVWLYISGGLCGGICYMLFAPMLAQAGSVLLGASAAVLALMTAAAVLLPGYTLHLFFLGDIKLKWVALFMILLAFLGLGGGNSGGELAHLGGALCGLAAGFVWSRKRSPRKEKETPRKPKHVSRVINVMEQHRLDAERLDELLDKIRISGFDSLSADERRELEYLSKRVTK